MRPEAILSAVLAAAACGFRIVPCPPDRRYPVLRSWPELATTDEATIRAWWAAEPQANPAAVMGAGHLCLDLDDGGLDALEALEALYGSPLPGTLGDSRPSAPERLHLFYTVPAEITVANSIIGPGIDIKGERGCVAIPPARYPDAGERRCWLDPEAPIGPAPAWLLGLVRVKTEPAAVLGPILAADGDSAYGVAALEGEEALIRAAGRGSRNSTLVRSAFRVGRVVGGGELTFETAFGRLEQVGVWIGLPAREVRDTVGRALRAGIARPRLREDRRGA